MLSRRPLLASLTACALSALMLAHATDTVIEVGIRPHKENRSRHLPEKGVKISGIFSVELLLSLFHHFSNFGD